MPGTLIRKVGAFDALDDADANLLAGAASENRTFFCGEDIISEGKLADHVHLILDGWACRYQVVSSGGRQIIKFLIPGDFCNAQIAIPQKMDHGVLALTEVRVALVTADTMLDLLDRPAIARAICAAILVEEAASRAMIVSLGRRDAIARIAHLLCEMHFRLSNAGLALGYEFDFPITQESLGDATGLTPIHCNRVLRRLREAGVVTFRRGQVVIHDYAQLSGLADFDGSYLHLASAKRKPW